MFEPHRLMPGTVIDELEAEQATRERMVQGARFANHLVDHAERVTPAKIPPHIDRAVQHVDELDGNGIGDVGSVGGRKQRRADFGRSHHGRALEFDRFFADLERLAFPGDNQAGGQSPCEGVKGSGSVLQTVDPTEFVEFGEHGPPRSELQQRSGGPVSGCEAEELGVIGAQT